MTASRPDVAHSDASWHGRARWAALVVLLCLGSLGCKSFSPAPLRSPIQPLPRLGAVMPDEADHAARDIATAILLDSPADAWYGMQRVEEIDAARVEAEELPTGLLPYAALANIAVISDPIDRRIALRLLLRRDDLDDSLRTRLQERADDDPIKLAEERLDERRMVRWGRLFNAISVPAGRSLSNFLLLPARLVPSLMNLALVEYDEDALTLRERQALDHWKRYVEENPEAPEAVAVLGRIQEAQVRWLETQHERSLRRSRRALENDSPKLAALMATRSLRYRPEDAEAIAIIEEAAVRAAELDEREEESVAVSEAASVVAPGQRALLLALLLPDGDVESAARALHDAEPEGPLADEARFALALAASETAPGEDAAWDVLGELSEGDSNSARHAHALVTNPHENPWYAFQVARGDATEEKLRWLAFGPLANGPRDRDLPRSVEWAVEVPTMIGALTGLPNRLIRYPFMPSDWKTPAVLARRYLERNPDGLHAIEIKDWLRDYESKRGNHVGALTLTEELGDESEKKLAKLREKAAKQAFEASAKQDRRDVRHAMLRQVAQRFKGTAGGRYAGLALREEFERGGAQSIRISRGFLLENPSVGGPEGLALAPGLLDEEPSNGELHPEGITLLGGRMAEFAFLGESGRESEEPRRVRRRLSEERMARLASQLEESSLDMALTDRDVPVEPDADRDIFLERARLGLADQPDVRANAESRYVYRGARERYGLVRGRESILPVEIVLQGSFDDFGLGAFPRIRMPKKTPDSFLYED
ncbi:MAG: hypothetical protein QNK05_11420 [Myxococcota bacterium]|nr:hypothetical protein [Myxococcota bacterium]